MEIREVEQGEFTVLTPVGKLDTKTAGEFERKLLGLLSGGKRRFVVDLVELEHLSSAGLRVLLMLGKKLGAPTGATSCSAT